MPASRPSAADVLAGVIDYLERELLPTLEGRHRFHCRVAANALATVKRELELAPAAGTAEAERLRALLGRDGDLDTLNRELAARIRAGEIAIDDKLVEHLKRSVADALAINNPKWTRE
jgi:hypothetical protein